jgi:hypothetical protein
LDKFNIETTENNTVVNLFVVSKSKGNLVSLIESLSTKYKKANTDSIQKVKSSYKAIIKVVV